MSTFRNTEGKTVHENLMNLLDQAGVCVLIAAGENGRIVSTNKAALKFLEAGPDDVSGEPAEEVLKKVHEGGITVDRTLVEENGVLYQVFSFRMSSGGLTDFERVIRDLDDVYFKTTLDGKILAASPSVESFSGYRPEEVLGRPITSFYRNPDDRGVLLEKLREKGRLSEYQVEMLGRNGRVIHARGAIHLVYDDEGEPAFIEGILTDITARKKLEDRIRNDSLFFNQVLESVPDAVVIIDRNGIVTGWNPEAARLFGWTSEEAIGRPLDDLVYTGSGRNEIQSMDVIKGKVIRGLECTRRGKDPVEKKVFVSVAPIVMDDESAGAVGIYTDLSDRESILEKLRENEVKFRSITDSAQDAVIIMDENGCVSFFNSSAERMFGYHRTETMGRQLHELISPEAYWEMFDMGFAEFRRTGKGIVIGRVMEMEGRRKDGTVFPVELSVSSFYMNGGWHATGILRDITERKKIELELIDAREGALNAVRTKSEFLANMSHEIRTPLNAIIGTTDLLWETNLDQRQRNYLRVCRNAGENLLSLIDDILDISKVEAGRIELETIPFDLVENVERTCETLALRAHEKSLELNVRIMPGTPGWVLGDPSRVRQILINLIGNAIKFTENGGVTVTVRSDPPGSIVFSVEDTGIGIPSGKLESIFYSFTQADTSHTRRFGGTGLGLTICKKLTELMGGAIQVRSELGLGTEFTVTLPLGKAVPPGHAESGEKLESLEGVTVLVVDDNSLSREILCELLQGWQALPEAVSGGEEALAAVSDRDYDVVLLDCMMPGMDGFSTVEAMRKKGVTARSVIMMVTSDGGGSAEECRSAGVDSYLVKPVRRNELREQMLGALGRRRHVSAAAVKITDAVPVENRKLTILLAEDSPDNRFLIQKYLESYPWEVVIAENGREALDLYSSGNRDFDLVLMDMQMPVMDGYEATRAIRALEARKQDAHVPVVALTAHAMKEEIQKCIEAGCDLHIAKPVRKKNLIRELNDLLEATGPREGLPEDLVAVSEGVEEVVAEVPADLETLIPGYLSNRRKDIISMKELLDSGDFAEVARLAHSMKGSGGGYGFDRISALGAEMEKAAKESEREKVLNGLQQLGSYLDSVRIEYVDEE